MRLATTPGQIGAGFLAIALAALLAAVVNLWSASQTASAIHTIGRDAEPSVVLALRIGAALSDLDATAVEDALAAGMSAAGTSARWREGKASLDGLLVQASRNITYPDETVALRGLLRWTGEYQASLAEARGAADPARPFTATQRLQWSHRLVREFALPEAEALALANRKPLTDAYGQFQTSTLVSEAATIVGVLLLGAILVGTQMFLTRRTRRLVNAPLAAATVLCAGLLTGLVATAALERAAVRAAKVDSYESLDALFAAKGIAAVMNADLSLWLLDPATRPAASQSLDTRARALLDLDWRDSNESVRLVNALQVGQERERQGQAAAALAAVPARGGLLGKALSNITFGPAERDPASDAVRGLLGFLRVADQVRDRGAPDQATQALQLREREGAAALAGLDGALDRTIAVNQAEFDRRIAQATSLAAWVPPAACAVLAVIVLLSAVGLWQRYREYA